MNILLDIINEEETQFLKTLSRGQKLMEKIISQLDKNVKIFLGNVACRLYDTYGFPYDLTQLICEESGLVIDQEKIIALNDTINQSQISYWRKDSLRKELENLKKSSAELF